FEGGQVVQQARAINPKLLIIARAHSEPEIEHLKKHGADLVVMGEHEIAKAMLDNIADDSGRGRAPVAAENSVSSWPLPSRSTLPASLAPVCMHRRWPRNARRKAAAFHRACGCGPPSPRCRSHAERGGGD